MSRFYIVMLWSVVVVCPSLAAEEKKPDAGLVEVKGLSLYVKPAKNEFGGAEALSFDVTLKNTSDKAFQLDDPDFYMYDVNAGTWQCILKNAGTKKEYRPTATVRPEIYRFPRSVELAPGGRHTTKIALDRRLPFPVVEENPGGAQGPPGTKKPGLRGPGLANQPFPGGKYTLAVTANLREGKDAEGLPGTEKKSDAPFWTGSISVETAQFDVIELRAGDPPKIDGGGWVNLFADEDWYKRREGKEQWFTGVLNAIKQDPNVETTLQRTSLYSLDKRAIYTGAKKVDALDALVGKVVTIRGKAVAMKLEGRDLREIWPGAVREVKEGLRPIEVHPVPVDPPAVPAPPDEGEAMDSHVTDPNSPVQDRLPAKPEPIQPPIELDQAR